MRCRHVARDFKPQGEGRLVRGALEAMKAPFFAYVAGVGEKSREQGQDEVKLMFIDVKKKHFNTKCDEEEWTNSRSSGSAPSCRDGHMG